MSKEDRAMTERQANEIFRSKYPEGEIVRKNASSAGSRYFVVFKGVLR